MPQGRGHPPPPSSPPIHPDRAGCLAPGTRRRSATSPSSAPAESRSTPPRSASRSAWARPPAPIRSRSRPRTARQVDGLRERYAAVPLYQARRSTLCIAASHACRATHPPTRVSSRVPRRERAPSDPSRRGAGAGRVRARGLRGVDPLALRAAVLGALPRDVAPGGQRRLPRHPLRLAPGRRALPARRAPAAPLRGGRRRRAAAAARGPRGRRARRELPGAGRGGSSSRGRSPRRAPSSSPSRGPRTCSR